MRLAHRAHARGSRATGGARVRGRRARSRRTQAQARAEHGTVGRRKTDAFATPSDTPTMADASSSQDTTANAPSERAQKLLRAASRRVSGVHCVLEGLENSGNRAAILRTVEALGLLHVHEVSPLHEQLERGRARGVAHGGEKWLTVHRHEDAASCRRSAALQGVTLLAALPPEAEMPVSTSWHALGNRRRKKARSLAMEHSDGDVNDASLPAPPPPPPPLPRSLAEPIALEDIDFAKPVALAFGNERLGLSPEFLTICDGAFHIPLYGFTESLNVSVAVAIALHHARLSRTLALRASNSLNAHGGDLNDTETAALADEYSRRGKHYAKANGETQQAGE